MDFLIKELDKLYSERLHDRCIYENPKDAHYSADECLVTLLQNLGFEKTAEEYEKVEKYYS